MYYVVMANLLINHRWKIVLCPNMMNKVGIPRRRYGGTIERQAEYVSDVL